MKTPGFSAFPRKERPIWQDIEELCGTERYRLHGEIKLFRLKEFYEYLYSLAIRWQILYNLFKYALL